MWHSTILVVMTKRKERKKKTTWAVLAQRDENVSIVCVYTPATVDLYLLFVSRCLYIPAGNISVWWAVACQVSQLDHFIICVYIFSSLFLKKRGKKICSVLLWDIGKVTERKLAYRVLYSENVYQNLGLQRLTCRGMNTWSGEFYNNNNK